jgi:hypothetical protein
MELPLALFWDKNEKYNPFPESQHEITLFWNQFMKLPFRLFDNWKDPWHKYMAQDEYV